MEKTEEKKSLNLLQKISEARIKFLMTDISKTGYNEFSKYDYFDLSDILPTCLSICHGLKFLPIISFSSDVATMTVYDMESSDTIVITSPMDGANLKGCHEIQNTGARETYSRRYLWFALFEITEHDVLDSSQPLNPTSAKNPPKEKRNANSDKTDVPDFFNPARIWSDVVKYFGYSNDISEEEKNDCKQSARAFLKDKFGIDDPKNISKEHEEMIYDAIRKGPEAFVGDVL